MAQVLPLVPPEEEFWSPYTGLDALCGSTLMISLDELVKEGLLDKADLPEDVDHTLAADFFKVSHLCYDKKHAPDFVPPTPALHALCLRER
jgi:hypothetical protein